MRAVHRGPPWLLALIFGGCTGTDVPPRVDLVKADAVATLLEWKVKPGYPARVALISGLTDAGVAVGQCASAVEGLLASKGAALRAMQAGLAMEQCHLNCPFDLVAKRVEQVPPADRSKAYADLCNESGHPDTVFVGELGAGRDRLALIESVLVRFLYEELREGLRADGTPEARAVGERYDRILPQLVEPG